MSGLTKVAALDYAKSGIRVNAVGTRLHRYLDGAARRRRQPRNTRLDDQQTPAGRMGNPKEIAQAIVWLCSDEASFVTGTIVPVDGGMIAR